MEVEILDDRRIERRVPEGDALELDLAAERFATRRGGRSARGARQFVDSLLATPDTLN